MRKHRTKMYQFLWQSLRLCFTLFAHFFSVKRVQKTQRHFVPDFFFLLALLTVHCATAREARSVFTVVKSYAVRLIGAAKFDPVYPRNLVMADRRSDSVLENGRIV